jgi:hypothetical protein
VASLRSGLDLEQPERQPQVPSSVKKTGYAAGHLGTQGKRRWRNADGKFECRECRKEHGGKRDFYSTEGLRKHERKYHNRPGEGRKKLSNADKVGDEPLKALEVKLRKIQKNQRKTDNELRKVQKKQRKMGKELRKAVMPLSEVKKSTL